MDLTEDHLDLMRRIRDGRALPLADRKQDRVRQQCRMAGLIKVEQGPRRWVLTSLGVGILEKVELLRFAA